MKRISNINKGRPKWAQHLPLFEELSAEVKAEIKTYKNIMGRTYPETAKAFGISKVQLAKVLNEKQTCPLNEHENHFIPDKKISYYSYPGLYQNQWLKNQLQGIPIGENFIQVKSNV